MGNMKAEISKNNKNHPGKSDCNCRRKKRMPAPRKLSSHKRHLQGRSIDNGQRTKHTVHWNDHDGIQTTPQKLQKIFSRCEI